MPISIPEKLNRIRELYDANYWLLPTNGKVATKRDWQNERVEWQELEDAVRDNKLDVALVLNRCELIDVECDTPEAEATLQELFGEIPPTPTFKSPRGQHRFFRRPEGLPAKAVIKIDGIEFRIGNGKGAYTVVPPSNGRRWLPDLSLSEVEPAELPEHVVSRLCRPPKKQTPETDERIPEGQRNDVLFKKACAFRGLGLDEEGIANALLEVNDKLCDPALPEDEVRNIAHSAASGETQAKIGFLERLLPGIELWHDQNDDPFATLPQGEHKENWKIGKKVRAFRRWLSKQFYDMTGEVLSSQALGDIAGLLEGRACFDGPKYKLWRRVAEHEGTFYIDLADEDWRAIEVDTKGWRVVSNPPVKFFRARAMEALPVPEKPAKGETLKSLLKPFLNIEDVDWVLGATWLAGAFRPRGPYPILKLLGEHGSAKTTQARIFRQLIDPNAAPVRAEPKSTRDLMIQANNAWVMCFDNLSSMKPDLSDALCRLATGGGFSTRCLYTDEDEAIFDAMRPAILTSIEEIGSRSDLLDRCEIIELPPIDESQRRAEKEFWAEFEKVRAKVFGALLDGIVGALNRLPEVEAREDTDLSRLADFEQWAIAAEVALGFESGTFVEAYHANQEKAHHISLEAAPIVTPLFKLLAKPNALKEDLREIEYTAEELLKQLNWLDSACQKVPGWPKTARVLSQILKRIAPNLRQIGITAVQDHQGSGNAKRKIWRITAPKEFEVPGAGRTEGSQKTTVRPAKAAKKTVKKASGSQGSDGSQFSRTIKKKRSKNA